MMLTRGSGYTLPIMLPLDIFAYSSIRLEFDTDVTFPITCEYMFVHLADYKMSTLLNTFDGHDLGIFEPMICRVHDTDQPSYTISSADGYNQLHSCNGTAWTDNTIRYDLDHGPDCVLKTEKI